MPQALAQVALKHHIDIDDTLRLERSAFGAKLRAARAILGLSQEKVGDRVGLTQRSVHRIEQGLVEPRLRTMLTIEQFWQQHGIAFDDLPDGGFRLAVQGALLRGQ